MRKSFDTVLAVYRGNDFPLTSLGNNDDTPAGVCPSTPSSRVTFSTAAGVTHRIAVAGLNGSSGYFQLNLAVTPDVTAPDTTISGGPSGPVASGDASVSFTSATASQAGAVKVVLKLTKKARKRLAKVRRVTATLRVLATDAAGNRTLVTNRLSLKR